MPRRSSMLVLVPLLLAAGMLGAQRAGDIDAYRFYVGGLCAYRTVGGEFTGDVYLSDGSQVFFVPEVGASWGYGGLVGFRIPHVAQELSYTRSLHVGLWDDAIEFESLQQSVAWDVRILPLRLGPVEPFALLGMSFLWLEVYDGVSDGSTSVDATYHGFGWDFGGGISVGIGAHLSLVVQGVYHLARYNTVDDFWGDNLTISDGLAADGWDLGALMLFSW